YPNPVHGGDFITIEGVPEGVTNITIYDLNGRAGSTLPVEAWRATTPQPSPQPPLQSSPQSSLQLPIPTTPGVYLVRIGETLLTA
ncbi:T9SS type A sorting domain-containing protein, partial [Candidatus Symbiothrix dinenymphae]|uniref:T9SS type A sorting domain-containing protein n=1 Tax=Candidatus Symbiothrix dinenymphae TaxID=467085 RepID=UPI0013154431